MRRNRPSAAAGWPLAALLLTAAVHAPAADSTRPLSGIADRTPRVHALVHARIVTEPGRVLDDATLVLRDGRIEAVGRTVSVPADAEVIDLAGRTVYPGFLDAASVYGLQPPAAAEGKPAAAPAGDHPMAAGAHHWNPGVHPESDAAAVFTPRPEAAARLRALGFTAARVAPAGGILRGKGAWVALGDAPAAGEALIADGVSQDIAFETLPMDSGRYPVSLMGSIALIRQTLSDARWYARRLQWESQHPGAARVPRSRALAALEPLLERSQVAVFATRDELDYARALALAQEFGLRPLLLGNGREYRDVRRLQQAGVGVILPLELPPPPAVEDPDAALEVGLEALQHWRLASANARVLAAAGVPFAFTTRGLSDVSGGFWPALRKLVAQGMDERDALAALTLTPARLLGVGNRLGTIAPGKRAHLVVADADLLRSEQAGIDEVWVEGRRYVLRAQRPLQHGRWQLQWTGASGPAEVEVGGKGPGLKAGAHTFTVRALAGDGWLWFVPGAALGRGRDVLAFTVARSGEGLQGRATLPDGAAVQFTARLLAPEHSAGPFVAAVSLPALPAPAGFPAGEHARAGLPRQPDLLLVRGATLWTQTARGTLPHADLLVRKGVIAAVGRDLPIPAGAQVVEAQGMHVTPGIIDAHSHIAIARGVNEASHAVTSEVRVGDVLDPTDIGILRQLAGGVTTALLLHGSANAIGGQSQIIKLRWGADAEGLKFAGAPDTIKLALGENPKQSNWGDAFTTRYPQTRMGVEQIVLDRLLAAREYAAQRRRGHARDGGPLRRDLQLEAIAEVLDGRRLAEVHGYRQDELLAFVRLAQRFGFRPTFQHVLEGYKIADVLAAGGMPASTFSDWWAYKYEVIDAIPQNAALMAHQGVLVSINSDDEEMGRRLNQEAAKSIRYGGLSPQEALALVTSNPARQLGIADRVGSLAPGLQADFVLWNGDPLALTSRAEQTWIDGRRYFDRAAVAAERARIEKQRAELIALALPERLKKLGQELPARVPDGPAGPVSADAPADGRYDSVALAAWRPPYADSRPAHSCHAGER